MNPSSRPEAHALKWELACEVLRASGGLPFRVTGWSMFPTILPGDVLVVEPASNADISAGDIVLYENGRQLVAHRVLKKISMPAGPMIQTRGDAVKGADAPVAVDRVLGRVSYVLRNGERIAARRTRNISQRVVSGLVRRSRLAARVAAGMHSRHQSSENPGFTTQASSLQT